MIESAFHYCPRCGGKLTEEMHGESQTQVCSVCHKALYKNQNLTLTAIIIRDGKMLFVRRAENPGKGMLDLPGGFVEPDESAPDGMLREIKEELRVDGKIVKLFGYYGPSKYEYQDTVVYNGDLIYQIDIGEQEPVAGDDAQSIEWYPIASLPYGQTPFASQNAFMEDIKAGKIVLE